MNMITVTEITLIVCMVIEVIVHLSISEMAKSERNVRRVPLTLYTFAKAYEY